MSLAAYRPFIDDPEHRRLLEGQRYVVLRVRDSVRAAYRRIQGLVRERLAGFDLSYPAEPHVTLLSLAAGTDLDAVRALVNEWARDVPPLQIEVERIDEFPPPFQIAIIQIRRTSELFVALSRLRERARQRGLDDLATIAPGDWIFHLSLVYGYSLSAASWATVS
jgi:2'-5' RNA ligase